MSPPPPPARADVFINCPFDAPFEPLFVALIAGLVGLGRTPRCVLEINEGLYRLDKIHALMSSCAASVHDMSRANSRPTRFNMPFELGIAYALSRTQSHSFFVFEERPYRLQVTLSDVNGIDPHIHDGRPARVLSSVLNCFAGARAPSFAALDRLRRDLVRGVRLHKRDAGATTLFSRQLFRQSVATATSLAVEHRLLRAS